MKNYLTGNCVRLEGTGDLNHFKCAERFKSGCPTKPYTDEEIYKSEFAYKIVLLFRIFFSGFELTSIFFKKNTNIHELR